MRLSIASVVSCLAALATAYTQPDYSKSPSGNAILKPGLNELVPVGKPYTITWNPTTQGSISLVLLRGPSTNVVPIATLADSIPNSGSFSWTPSTSLEPDTSHYGLLLVVEGTGQYQYSTQFGISNPDYTASTSNSSSTPTTETKTSSTTETSKSSTTSTTTTTATSTMTNTHSTTADTTADTTTTLVTQTSTSEVPTTTVAVTVPNSTGATSSAVTSTTVSHSSTASPSATLSSGADRRAISLGAVVVGAFAVMAF